MVLTDFVKQTFLRIGSVVTIPIRKNVIVETTQIIWNAKLGVGELRVYLKPTCDDGQYQPYSQSDSCKKPLGPSHTSAKIPHAEHYAATSPGEASGR